MSNEAQHIMDSGELELYALGVLDPSRIEAVEHCLRMDDVLQAELDAIRLSLEGYAQLHAEEPQSSLRKTILDAAFAAEQNAVPPVSATAATQPASLSTAHTTAVYTASSSIPDTPAKNLARPSYFRYAVAASVACVISTGAAGYFWYQHHLSQAELADTRFELATLKTDQQVMAARLQMHDTRLALVSDTNVRVVNLQATATAPAGSTSIVMWNTQTHEVYVEGRSLPANTGETDYQLWALVDGKPVDLGTFNTSSPLPLNHMKATARADAFAITLEPKGGSKSPTLSQMIVMGKAS